MHHVIIVTLWIIIIAISQNLFKLFLRCGDAVTNRTRSVAFLPPSTINSQRLAQVPNVKLRPPPLQPRSQQTHDPDASYDRSSDSEIPPNASMVDLCPRPFRGFSICATGTIDKVRHTTQSRYPPSYVRSAYTVQDGIRARRHLHERFHRPSHSSHCEFPWWSQVHGEFLALPFLIVTHVPSVRSNARYLS